MAGETNGTTVILQKGSAPVDIVGQGEFTITIGGEPITFENKSNGDWVNRLADELSGKEVVMSGTLTYNSDTVYQEVLTDAQTGAQDDYLMTLGDGRSFAGLFVAHGLSYALPVGGVITTPITFSSNGAVTPTEPT